MTFEEACQALGWDEPQHWMKLEDRKILIDTVMEHTDDRAKPLDPRDACRFRAETEMFFPSRLGSRTPGSVSPAVGGSMVEARSKSATRNSTTAVGSTKNEDDRDTS